ncbi:ribonuclease H-like domain-containing protein, partial [Tanacetum coccineum]
VDEFDLEEMDLKWQVARISMRLKKFYKKTGKKLHFDAKEPVGFDKTKVECFNCHNTGHFVRECRSKGNQESRRRDAGNTGYKAKDNGKRHGKHNPGSDTEVTSCSKECVESYAKLKKIYDEQREQLGDASIEIQAYTQALKKVEAQLVCHQKNQLIYEEKVRFMKIDLDDKTNVLAYHKKLLAEAVKEKEELKTKLENFQSSSKGLSKLLNSQMSTGDKYGLGPINDRFANVEGMHAVPSLMTGIYMPSKSDFGIDVSKFTYGQKQSKTSEFDAKTSDTASCETNSMPRPVVNEPKAVSKPKVWSDAPIIEEYESDSDDEYVIKPSKEQEKPSCAFVNIVKHVKTPRETIKEQNTCSPSPKADKRDWNGLMFKRLGLGYGFTKKACFKGKATGQDENRPVWNNVQRLNHQNKFVPKAILTKTDILPINTARQTLSSQAAITSTARKVNNARPIIASTPIETQKPLTKDEEAADVDVTPKTSHLHAVKRIFRYLKGKPKLGLWYPRESSLDLEAYSDSDYARVNLDRKFTTGGCQFLSRRLISWQCKKQTIVATSTKEAEYVAAANCCGQVL